MPRILTRLVSQLREKGFSEGSSRAIAVSSLQKYGNLEKGSTKPTKKGLRRGKMTPAERAKDRAAKYSGKHDTSAYKYTAKTNRATLKK